MTRFNQYIVEGYQKTRRTEINEENAAAWVKDNASDALKAYKNDKCRIYRGTNAITDVYLLDPEKSPNRMSANTANYYTLFMNNDSSWSEYPKREIICTTNRYNTYHARCYIVIPKDGAKIGVCPHGDIWATDTKYGRLDVINEYISSILYTALEATVQTPRFMEMKTIGEMKKAFKFIDDNKKYVAVPRYWAKFTGGAFFRNYLQSKKSFYDFYASIMEPTDLGFKVVNVGHKFQYEREVWMDSVCLLVNMESLPHVRLLESWIDEI